MGSPARATAPPSAPSAEDWAREVPKYLATRPLEPAEEMFLRYQPPRMVDSDHRWQYGHRPLKAGELITTGFWPHPSFRPINESGRRVLGFYNSHLKHGFGLRWNRG
jgi:hypothetical protein